MWQSLYLYCDDGQDVHSAADCLRKSLIALEFELYDPFSLIPGKAYKQARRFFIAPQRGRWVRIIGDVDEDLLPMMSEVGLCLLLKLQGDTEQIHTYHRGEAVDLIPALMPHLVNGCTPRDMERVLVTKYEPFLEDPDSDTIIPAAALPEDVREMAKSLNANHITKLFNKLMNKISKRLPVDEDGARELLRGGAQPGWGSAGGQRIIALVKCLTLPGNYWREPDFVTLRDAYQQHLRRRRKPNVTLLPGDRQTMEGVPDALDYLAVYGGKVE